MRKKHLLVIAGLATLAAAPSVALAISAGKEEQKLIEISKFLKPMADSQWNEIAGSKVSDTYEIAKGDTLWDISKRLFGNAFYWPKVWSFNSGINNPHVVEPGQKLAFTAGTSESTPKLAPSTAPESAAPPTSARLANAGTPPAPREGEHEYDRISPELWTKPKPAAETKNYDEFGIDKDIKIDIPARFTFRVPLIANDTTVPYLGEIVSTRREGLGLSQHETVFLKSNSQDLQVGSSYTVFGEPEFARERKSDRSGYIYRSIGEVKIVGVRDELYVGVITTSYDVVLRGMKVYPLLPLISDLKPLPARTALEALVVTNTA
ncbi:MAG: LysM peptidoglycan-binding domain-containing protein, partial [Deltaproteobacteria bacterium]|nr:LysM peptidoglycan-binding domain-containing protein [Deltaproteobacteria bacterium]